MKQSPSPHLDRVVTIGDVTVPTFLYGTAWKEDRTEDLVLKALAAGFAGIDTANQRRHYHEAGVGRAVAGAVSDGAVSRDRLFLQTKFTYAAGQDHRLPYDPEAGFADQVRQSFESSLDHLETTYVDSYVLHGPSTGGSLAETDWEVWRAMESIHGDGRAKLLGVSNINLQQLMTLVEGAKIKPSFVQNRCFARDRWDFDIRKFCVEHSITYQGFSLLTANVRELSVRPIAELVNRKQRSVPEMVFRFAQHLGMIPLTGTTNEAHMAQDLTCYQFELSSEEIDLIENIAR